MDYNRQKLEAMRAKYPIGTRVELGHMEGEADMPSGLQGTVEFIDDAFQIHVTWSNGRTLAINCEVDSFKIVRESDRKLNDDKEAYGVDETESPNQDLSM